MENVVFQDLGKMGYQAAWDYQTHLHQALVENKLQHRGQSPFAYEQKHHFLLVEHPPVYTLGKSGSSDNLLLDESALREKGIQYFPINRGGDITYHGPGQVVGYPILDLERFFTDVHRYVRSLEEMIIRTLAEFGIEGQRIKGYTGVWVSGPPSRPIEREERAFFERNRKICAIGVHLSRWTTLHGFALNVNTDLRYFDYIVPCGIADEDKTVTSIERELGRPVDQQTVKDLLCRNFESIFECRLVEVSEPAVYTRTT